MTIVLRLVSAALIGLAGVPGAVLAEGASRWTEGFHSRARLIAGASTGPERWVGVEIVLDRGFKTYWREPGDSGLPPRFDWSGSTNAKTLEVRWPAPSRTEDGGGVTHTYAQRVVFPVRVTAADPGQPVSLQLDLDYGVCKEICIPAQAALDLTVGPGGGPHREGIEEALARVPRPQPLGAAGPLSITAVERIPGEKPSYRVSVRSPDGATLFT